MYNINDKKGTGRTTRMLSEASKLCDKGRAVYVIAASAHEAKRLQHQSGDERIKFETEQSVGNLDWGTMSLSGAHPNCVVLVDHWVIQQRLHNALVMLHRFDNE